MRMILFGTLTFMALTTCGQVKYDYVHFNTLTEVEGTAYMIASVDNKGSKLEASSSYLLFIDTKTGETHQVDFPSDASIGRVEQVKIDSLDINLLVVSARTIDLDGKNGIDWSDPTQLIILSHDGKERTQITDNKFFVRSWKVNRLTGTIVVAGHFDTNENNKYDKTDKSEIHIYDLRTLRLIGKI